jgi:hypothetical protein
LLFLGLFNVADDEGRMRAAPALIHGQVFPYDEDVEVGPLLDELEAGGFVQRYESDDGQRFMFIRGFLEHQKIDHPTKSRFPPPPRELLAKPSRKPRESFAPDQGTGNREQGVDQGKDPSAPRSAEQPADSPPEPTQDPQPIVVLPCVGPGKPTFSVSQAQADQWAVDFPGVDVVAELRHMRAWCDAKPGNRKTIRGVTSFVVGWLGREQDKHKPGRNGKDLLAVQSSGAFSPHFGQHSSTPAEGKVSLAHLLQGVKS